MSKLAKHIASSGLAYHRSGQGPVVVLLHGVGLRAESWRASISALHTDYELVVPDLPEHGDSTAMLIEYDATLDNYADVIAEFIDSTITSQVILCGHSLGALIAIELTAKLKHKVSALIALNTIYQRSEAALVSVKTRAESLRKSDSIIGVEQTIERWFGVKPTAVNAEYAAQCEGWLKDNTVSGYAKAYRAFANELGARESSLGAISCPSIFMTGAKDPNSTPAMSNQIAAYTNQQKTGVSVQAIVLKNAGHMLPLTHSKAVCEQIKRIV